MKLPEWQYSPYLGPFSSLSLVVLALPYRFVWNIFLDFLTVWAMAIDDSDPQELGRASSKCALQVIISGIITSSFFFLTASLVR